MLKYFVLFTLVSGAASQCFCGSNFFRAFNPCCSTSSSTSTVTHTVPTIGIPDPIFHNGRYIRHQLAPSTNNGCSNGCGNGCNNNNNNNCRFRIIPLQRSNCGSSCGNNRNFGFFG